MCSADTCVVWLKQGFRKAWEGVINYNSIIENGEASFTLFITLVTG